MGALGVGLLIKDITVEKPSHPKQLFVHIRWQGGACSDLSVPLPANIADRVRYPAGWWSEFESWGTA